MQVNETFQPTIVAFCCNWCSYAGADLSGTNRLQYPANVKIIRIPCSCRLNPTFILRAFQRGADGVILCGCHPGDCHYTTGNYYARRRMTLLFSLLDYLGIERERTRVEWFPLRKGPSLPLRCRNSRKRPCFGGKSEIGGPAMQGEVKAKAVELLRTGSVDRVLGWKAGTFFYDLTPAVFETAEEVERDFVWSAFSAPNLSKYLIAESRKPGKIAAFLKPCDTYSFSSF